MKTIFLILSLISFSSFASTVDIAYKAFFDDPQVSSNHCGRNIHFFLKYLDQNNISYKQGYVVSLHEEYWHLNHFDARWGRTESYEDGESHSRSNWFFHVFVVIDNKAYDFSQTFRKNQTVLEYLESAYLPKSRTGPIPMQGRLIPEKVIKDSFNLEMKIYSLQGYKKDFGGPIYEGTLIELFNYYRNISSQTAEGSVGDYSIAYETKNFDSQYGSVTYTYPKAGKEGNLLPLKANDLLICRALGYLGAVPVLTKHEVSDKIKMYQS